MEGRGRRQLRRASLATSKGVGRALQPSPWGKLCLRLPPFCGTFGPELQLLAPPHRCL